MVTDTRRKRRTDPGEPNDCPVFTLHKAFVPKDKQDELAAGCRTAGIGCLECKTVVIERPDRSPRALLGEAGRASSGSPRLVWDILEDGNAKARAAARATMDEVRAGLADSDERYGGRDRSGRSRERRQRPIRTALARCPGLLSRKRPLRPRRADDGYQIRLGIFEGPLDLLLFLIRKKKIDIHDIPIAVITREYLAYLDRKERINLDREAEFLLMAALLIYIKSQMLLPREKAAGRRTMTRAARRPAPATTRRSRPWSPPAGQGGRAAQPSGSARPCRARCPSRTWTSSRSRSSTWPSPSSS